MGLVLVALIAAAPPLTVEQRKAHAAPLIEATRVVQKVIRLSDVGLSVDGTTAVIAVDSQAHWLAGSGETWFLRKTAAGWEKLALLRRWVS